MKSAPQRVTGNARTSDEDFYLALLAALAALTWGLIASFAIILNRNFLTIACDTAVLENGIVNTMHGHWFAMNGVDGPNILSAHTTFLLLLVIPFYAISPHPETLFALQTLGVVSTVIPLFLVALDLGLKPQLAFLIAITSLASAFLLHMAMAPFHLETWVAAAALWSYHFYLRNNLVGFLISLFVAVCCGEQAALIFIALGISLLVVEDGRAWRWRFGRVALVGGLAWIVLAVTVIGPLATGHYRFNIFAYNYTQWGITSAAGLPGAVLHHPGRAFHFLVSGSRWAHLLQVIGLLVVAAFLSWRSLLLFLLPLPAYLLMSDQEFYLYFHAYYYSFAFFAGYVGLLEFLRRDPVSRSSVVFLSLFWLASLISVCGAAGYYVQLFGGVDEPFSTTLRQQFSRIPPGATVYGPHRYSVYLSNRENFVMGDMPPEKVDFDAMVDAEFDKTNVHAAQIDYVVSDFQTDQCGWRGGFQDPNQFKARSDAIDRLVATGHWRRLWADNAAVILQRVK